MLWKNWLNAKTKENSIFSVYDPFGVKLLAHLRLKSIHLNEHKFRHVFGGTINAMCLSRSEVETAEHFLLSYHLYSPQTVFLVIYL